MDHCYFLKFVWQFSILYDLFLSFVFGLCLYLSLCLCLVSIFLTLTDSPNPTAALLTLWFYSTLATKTFPYPILLSTLCKLFLTLPFLFYQVIMCALRVQINKFIFEKVFLDQIPINFFQNWFYFCVPSHISKIFFFFFFACHLSSCPYYCPTISQQSNTTLIYSLISTTSTLSLSLISLINII